MIVCPFCQHEVSNNVCSYCFKTIDNTNEETILIYQLEKALVIKDYHKVIVYGKTILEKGMNNLILFYYEYATAFVEKSVFNFSGELNNDELLKAITFLERNKAPIEVINEFLAKLDNREVLNSDIDLTDELMPLVELPIKPEVNKHIETAKMLLILGGISFIIIVLISLLLPMVMRVFMTILLLVIPSLLLTSGLSKLNKRLRFFREIIFIFVLIVISYISLIYIEVNIFTHMKNVVLAPYDFLKYYIGKVIINL